MIQRIATVAVYVEDQQQALEFWCHQVGFELRNDQSMGKMGRWLEVAPAGQESRLVLYPRSAMPNWQELKPSIVFECDDIQATYASMKDRGVQFLEEPQRMAWGTYVRFCDPDNNQFLLRGP